MQPILVTPAGFKLNLEPELVLIQLSYGAIAQK